MASDSKVVVAPGGIGICGLMFLALFFCKVFDVAPIAAWSWWWIFAPLWIPLTGALVIVGIVFIVAYLVSK